MTLTLGSHNVDYFWLDVTLAVCDWIELMYHPFGASHLSFILARPEEVHSIQMWSTWLLVVYKRFYGFSVSSHEPRLHTIGARDSLKGNTSVSGFWPKHRDSEITTISLFLPENFSTSGHTPNAYHTLNTTILPRTLSLQNLSQKLSIKFIQPQVSWLGKAGQRKAAPVKRQIWKRLRN